MKLTELELQILDILKNKNYQIGLTLFEICEILGLETYKYEHKVILPSGIYFQLLIQHRKQMTVYRTLINLLKKGLIDFFKLTGKVGKPSNIWYLK